MKSEIAGIACAVAMVFFVVLGSLTWSHEAISVQLLSTGIIAGLLALIALIEAKEES